LPADTSRLIGELPHYHRGHRRSRVRAGDRPSKLVILRCSKAWLGCCGGYPSSSCRH